MTEIEVYCDESCHLESDVAPATLGALTLPASERKAMAQVIKDLKIFHGVPANREVKWSKLTSSKVELYYDLVQLYLRHPNMRFRAVVAHKEGLDHEGHNQSHQVWLQKIYNVLFKNFTQANEQYRIFFDPMDTWAEKRSKETLNLLQKKYPSLRSCSIVQSHDIQLMQITDILVGAISYKNRKDIPKTNRIKNKFVSDLESQLSVSLSNKSPYNAKKFNLFHWDEGCNK